MASVQQTTLRGWKEIATYVGRDVRTVQRWEARRGFPVSRLPGGDRGNVYALIADVDAWLHPSSKLQPAENHSGSHAVAGSATHAVTAEFLEEPADSSPAALEPSAQYPTTPIVPGFFRHRMAPFSYGLLAAGVAIAMLVFFRVHQERVQAGETLNHSREVGGGVDRSAGQLSAENQMYLQGMYLFEQRTPESLLEAKHALLEVTADDPKSAPGWAGLAEVSTLLYEYGVETDPGAPALARNAARRALALDPGLAEPHAVLGFADFFWHGDVRAAEPEFQDALRINPMSALARSWYGTLLTYEARYPEALEQLNHAQMLEPSSTAILSNRALALGLSGHREEAVQLLEKAGGDNSIASVRFHLALLSLVQPCDAAAFLREELAMAQSSHNEVAYQMFVNAQQAYQRGGEPAMWRAIVAYGEHAPVGSDILAGAHVALGEKDAALKVLSQAQRQYGPILGVAMNPLLVSLHRDPRFRQFVTAQGLPPVS